MTSRDVSKEVVVVLLLLTVVVALIGAISVTKTASSIEIREQMKESNTKTSGLVIASEPAPPQFGKASISFLNPGDELQ